MANFLLEIGLEEMPAHLVTPAINQLVERAATFMKENRLQYGDIKPFSTPRRLAILISEVADKADDLTQEVKGPAKKAAFDKEGNYSKAAQGFARGQGVTTDDITFKEFKGNEYIYVTKFEAGKPAIEVLSGFKEVIMSMTFTTTMKWARHTFEYVRPIRWIVALLDDMVVPFNVVDVDSGRETRGHRFLGQSINIAQASDYVNDLEKVYVQADASVRKANIVSQIDKLAAENNWHVEKDADLLEEVNNIVEYPTAFVGRFDSEYLDLPEEVLITSMREHQRFFHVIDDSGALLPYFVSVRNGNSEHLDNVIAGNEKVLIARLEDAKFFYHEDQKNDIDFYNDKLQVVSFHAKLGSVANHTKRAQALAAIIGQQISLTSDQQMQLARAAEIYKFDLMTGMVGEFDELQGIMGEKYALLFGEDPAVAQAIREHYMPISADGALPESVLGKVLALADKLDSLLSFFAGGMMPSGSNDPYALRRAASGVVNILHANDWHLPIDIILSELVDEVLADDGHFGLPEEAANNLKSVINDVITFLTDRVVKAMQTEKIRYDVINAVTTGKLTDTTQMFTSANALLSHSNDQTFREGVESLTRVMRLTSKNPTEATVNPALFENDAEKQLYSETSLLVNESLTTDDLVSSLLGLQPAIAAYFDQTMVMVEDEAVKQNRLATLQIVSNEAEKVANFMALDVKSN
ncbi:glycine--tRNA ligase subunit beta [Weissella paramesenteroides]|uniref:glycine--tRNA ligase subunit beta n=1 Tax=Weissella paramesenteroides TaxID=1249 RepID=UPI00123AC688|nr:glycine--tRNA ligase subunit beta [Weissella paramesenteroides]KAA8439216.1 glycine--tRNA ligase subunit beta [Weissella paramesenteroides]KAA8439539.1 glycine--tRNA ligase subunit beta [Weissella paramesenteroides]KAA8444013.1 glycine--tRNA ligase subunit beta [Weissella paramesenteroides]KAA8446494.1 glycine--tRNA ligase subunit beta [Weissella paramesenteroides]KAA8451563.1 glycine--tRNA ligase subunit beta [Weissella paramesenteroides]